MIVALDDIPLPPSFTARGIGAIPSAFPVSGGETWPDSARRTTEPLVPLSERNVDVPVQMIAGQRPPAYPAPLQGAGIAGDVVAQFIVDTAGRVEATSITILRASHDAFARAVRERLPTLRYVPAQALGRRVRQLVEQHFRFEVVR